MSTYYEHDMTWLELSREWAKAEQTTEYKLSTLRHITRPKEIRWDRDDRRTDVAIIAAAEALVADGDAGILQYSGRKPSLFLGEYNLAFNAEMAARAALVEHESNYTGWQRYFLVVSSAGLIHSSTRCSTCNKGRKATRFALLPTLSGRSYGDAVEVLGPSLCSVCFPEAPTAIVDGPKLPISVVEILFADGPDAFEAALAKHNEKKAAKAAKKGA